jgi:hypothetical protein
MVPYYLLYAYLVSVNYLKIKNKVKWKYLFIPIFILLSLRHPSMGYDLGYYRSYGYLASFEYLSSLSFENVLKIGGFQNYEFGFIIFNKIVSMILPNEQFFLTICAFLSFFPIAFLIKKYSKNYFLSIIVYLGLPSFLIMYSGLRQALAIGLTVFSFNYIFEKKLIKFIIIVFIASFFHFSSILFLSAYPIYYLRLSRKIRLATVLIVPLFVLFRVPLYKMFTELIGQSPTLNFNNSFTLLIVFTAIYILMLIFTNNDHKLDGWINLFYIACLVQSLASLNSIVLRVGYYFMPYLCIALPNLIIRRKAISISEYRVWYLLVVICFSLFGLYSIYITDWAQAYPYSFFFQKI